MNPRHLFTVTAASLGLFSASSFADTFLERSDVLLDYLNTSAPNVGQTGGGPHRIGRTGFWYGQARLLRGDTTNGMNYISAAVGDADAEGPNSGFSLWPGMDAWYRYNTAFSQALKDKYRDEYVGAALYGGATPNQRLMGATGCYLASEVWGAAAVTSHSNAANGYGDPTGKAFIHHILDNVPRYNCEEHNAGQYLTFNLGPIHTLANYAPDPLMRQKARMCFDWLLADTAPSWLNGYACISNTRGRVDAPQNAYNGTTNPAWWLFFGGPTPANMLDVGLQAQYTMPNFPGVLPEIVTAATDRSSSYTRRSVAQRYISGTNNAYFKQTWMTPKYAMWSQVEAEVGLNADGSLKINSYDTRYLQDGYQGERWGIAWDDAPTGESVITIKSPTTYSGSTGGISIYEDTLQHEDTLLAVYNIPAPSGQSGNNGTYPNQYVKGDIPNGYLAYTDESSSSGRIFLHYNNILVSIYLTNAFDNYSGSPGFNVPASKIGCIVETASPEEYPQSTAAARLAAFRADILATTTDKTGINDAAPKLTYTNRHGKVLSLTYGQAGLINGDPVDYLQWPTLGNPWMQQPPQGNLTIFGANRNLHYNFNDWTMTTNNRPTPVAAAPVLASGVNSIDIDLAARVADQETPANQLRYKISPGSAGVVAMLPDGHTARFTPSAGFSGTNGFRFSAIDADNDHRMALYCDFEQTNPTAGLKVADASGNARSPSVYLLGTGEAAADTSVPAAIANHSTQSLCLSSGSVGAANLSRQLYQANVHLSNGDWTFATWFKRASYADDDFVFHVGTGDGNGGDGDELQLYCEAQKQTIRLLHYSATNALDVDLTATGVAAGDWNHVALRFKRTALQKGDVTLFVNGNAVATATGVAWSLKQDVPVHFGGPAKNTALSRNFNGCLDDLAIYRGNLSDSEIDDLASGSLVHTGGLTLEQFVPIISPPLAPLGFSAALSGRNVVLSWSSVADGVTYTIQRANSVDGVFATLASNLSAVNYTDRTAVAGTPYVYRVIASNAAGSSPASLAVNVTIPVSDPSLWSAATMNAWRYGARIAFPGYTQAETLTLFPVLVALDANQIPGFSYSQFAYANGADLRFTDASGTSELNYEIDTWNPSGTSYVWVQVPALAPGTTICAFWGNPAASASAQPDSIANLSLWLKADALTGLTDGATVNTWTDSSVNARHATRLAGAPVFKTNVLNGKPVVRFPADGESGFSFPQLSDIRTVFWVVKETATSSAHFLLGDDNNYHFHRGTSGPIWSSTNTSANIRSGTTRMMGNLVNGTSTPLGSGYRLISVVTAGSVEASRLSKDRSIAARSWDGDVAEVIIYNRALSEVEESKVGTYLAQKYALSAIYPGVAPAYTSNGSAWSNGYLGVFHLRETSGQHVSSTSSAALSRVVAATSQGTASGVIGGADAFNGSSGYVSLPDLGASPQVTVEAWVNLTAPPGSDGGGIVSSDPWSSGFTHFKILSNRAFSAAISGSGVATSAAAAVPLGSWSHLAYTVAGNGANDLALYQNGSLLATGAGQSSNNLSDLNIAREYNGRYLNATFDEVRLSSVARSAAWLQASAATTQSPVTFVNASAVSTYAANALAMVAPRSASAITSTTATLNGHLSYTGGVATAVTFYWGTSDGGTTPANWANSQSLGSLPVGPISCNISGLAPGTVYYCRALASNTNGASWATDSVAFTTAVSAPGGLTFASNQGQVMLQWNAVTGAQSYVVKRSLVSGGPYTSLQSNVTGTSFIDDNATPGSSYYYVVSATNVAGESANSAQVGVSPLIAPTSLAIVPGNATVALSWTASAGASGYTIRRATSSGGPYSVQGSTTATSFNQAATNGTTYYYVVTATATGLESAPSVEKSVTPVASLTAPTGLAAVPSTGAATLTWSPVANAQSYTLKRSTTSGSGYTTVVTGLLSPSYTNSGLTNGTAYYYVVTAVSGSISSANSAQAAVTPATTPTVFTTASSGNWSTAVWTPMSPLAGFATSVVFNNSSSISSSQNLGTFLFNNLQLSGAAVALSGQAIYLSGSSPSVSTTNNVAHSISNAITLDVPTSFIVPSNTLTLSGAIAGTGGIVKSGAGVLSLGGLNSYEGNTVVDGGTLRYTTDNFDLNSLIIGGSAGSTSSSAIDLTSASVTATGLTLQNNSATANTVAIGAGKTLTIQGDVQIGTYSSATTSSTRLNVTGAGALLVSNESGQFSVGTSNAGSGVTSTVDLSGLQTFNLQYPSEGGILVLGSGSSGSTKAATLILGVDNRIEVDAIELGYNQVSSATQTLRLGSGSNIIRAHLISLGTTSSPSGGGRGIGSLLFNQSSGTLNLRDPSGAGGCDLFIADRSDNGNGYGTFDVTGHDCDIKLNSLRMGASTNATARTDTFSFNQGVLDIISLDVGLSQNGATRTSQINLGGGTVTLGNGDAENHGRISLATNAVGSLTITGGTVSAFVNITESTGTGSATLTLNGGTLDLRQNAFVDLTTLNLQSGTLKNVAQINGGAAITKSGSGVLSLDGVNAFTSPISIGAGTLQLLSTHTLSGAISGTGTLLVAPSGSLTGFGTVSAPTTVQGSLSPTAAGLNFSNSLTFSGGRVRAVLASDTAAAGAMGSIAMTGNLTSAAPVDLIFNAPGSTVNFSATFWESAQSWPILSAASIVGNFTLGTASSDSTARSSAAFGNFTLQQNASTVTLIWTPLSALEKWRYAQFGSSANSGIGADSADADGDGVNNLAEYNAATNPNDPTSVPSFIWTNTASGSWSAGANWSGGASPVSNAATKLEFFTGNNTLPSSTIVADNNLGSLLLNRLRLGGSGSGNVAVNLTGAALDFRSVGAVLPSIQLAASPTTLTYTVANNLILGADLTFDASDNGKFLFTGVLSGTGGLTRSGTASTLILAGNNTYQGTTTISSGTLQIGNDGASGTLGSGAIVNNASLRVDRSGTIELANSMSGSGTLIIDQAAAGDVLILSGANRFSGIVTVNRGTLRLTRSDALGDAPKSLLMQGVDRRLQLSGGITMAAGITLVVSSNSFDGGGISNLDGSNRIEGPIQISTGNPALNLSSSAGTLTVAGNVSAGTTGRSLSIGGASTSANTISGVISNGATSALPLVKQGVGTWQLTNANTYTGTTSINGGKLVLSGSLTSDVTVASGTFAPQGSASTTGALVVQSSGRYEVRPGDVLSVGGAVTLAGELNVVAAAGLSAGTSYVIINKTSPGAVSGTFIGKSQGTVFSAGGYNWQISYTAGDGNDVAISLQPSSALASWRATYFGSSVNSGNGADSSDPNHDGESNLLEFATAQNPLNASLASMIVEKAGTQLQLIYTRSKAAVADGVTFQVQWSDTLNAWSNVGVTEQVLSDNGTVQTVRASVASGTTGRRFMRLSVANP